MDTHQTGKKLTIDSAVTFGQHFDFDQRSLSGAHSISGILSPRIELLSEKLAQQDELLAGQANELLDAKASGGRRRR